MKIEVKKFVPPNYILDKKLRNNFLFIQRRVFKALVDSSSDHPSNQSQPPKSRSGKWNGSQRATKNETFNC